MQLSGVQGTQGNRKEQGDKMQGKINLEDPVFVPGHSVSAESKNDFKQESWLSHVQTVSHSAHF